MITLLITSFLISFVSGLPQEEQPTGSTPIPIISQTEITGVDGSYNFSFETGNGIRMEEVSYIKKLPTLQGRSGQLIDKSDDEGDGDIQVKSGSYSYTAPDGTVISLSYIADENGFQPKGDHLPAIPEYVKRLLNDIPQTAEDHKVHLKEDIVHENNVRDLETQEETTTIAR